MEKWKRSVYTDASDLAANDDTGLRHQQAFYALYLFMGITPIVLFLIVPFVERRYNRKRQREMEQRRLTATKLAEPIREAHLRNLMEGYSMVSIFVLQNKRNMTSDTKNAPFSVCFFASLRCFFFILIHPSSYFFLFILLRFFPIPTFATRDGIWTKKDSRQREKQQ